MKVKLDNFNAKVEYFLSLLGKKKYPPGNGNRKSELLTGLAKLIKDYISELEIVTYGIMISIQGCKGTKSQLVWKSINCVLKCEFTVLSPEVEMCLFSSIAREGLCSLKTFF